MSNQVTREEATKILEAKLKHEEEEKESERLIEDEKKKIKDQKHAEWKHDNWFFKLVGRYHTYDIISRKFLRKETSWTNLGGGHEFQHNYFLNYEECIICHNSRIRNECETIQDSDMPPWTR